MIAPPGVRHLAGDVQRRPLAQEGRGLARRGQVQPLITSIDRRRPTPTGQEALPFLISVKTKSGAASPPPRPVPDEHWVRFMH